MAFLALVSCSLRNAEAGPERIATTVSPEGRGNAAEAAMGPEGYTLYPDISHGQSDLAHEALGRAYSADLRSARKALADLRALESAEHLPPLSQLLSLAIDVMRYQNSDYQDEDEEKSILASIAQASEQGTYLCRKALKENPDHPTYLLILGGIRGFAATLNIHANPSQALSDGFQALKLLERARSNDARLKDCYLGTGIFHCTAANAPLFVRATLKIIGRSVSMRTGLEALRISAYQGQYTPVSSQLFLIQFLSPYEEELIREKREIFRSLEETFPRNPFYTFLKNDENLCFHPDSFYAPGARSGMAARISAFAQADFASRRYGNLVRWQFTLLNPSPSRRYAPDSAFAFQDFGYYPGFIDALRYKRDLEDSTQPGEKPDRDALSRLQDMRDSCLALIGDSRMNPARKRFYAWHVTDALRWKPVSGRARLREATATSR
jgi:hypothetical protein